MLYTILKTKYKLRQITANDVWAYVDDGKITRDQAITICGPRPVQESIGG